MAQNNNLCVTSSSSPNFDVVRQFVPYVDKSLLVKDLFDPQNKIFGSADDERWQKIALITAPSSFGKSVNMDMIQRFIGIQVTQDMGITVPRESNDSNYRLFQGLKIMDDPTFVENMFGKRPILKVNFFCSSHQTVTSLKRAHEFCRTVVHMSYLQHKYLRNSANLNNDEKQVCLQWCDMQTYKQMTPEDTREGLKILSTFLHKHHGKKVFMLVDEYDSVAMKAMYAAPEKILFYISRLPVDIVAAAMRYNGEHVVGGILTGISYIAGIGLSADLKIDHVFKFLQMRYLDKYYGLTDTEVGQIFDDFGWTEVEKRDAQAAYDNYLTQGEEHIRVYNMWSVIKHLEAIQDSKRQKQNNVALSNAKSTSPMRPKRYWMNSTGIAGIGNAYQYPALKSILNAAVRGENLSANIYSRIEEKHLKMLRVLVADTSNTQRLRKKPKLTIEVPTHDLFLTFMLEQGCLTYVTHNELKHEDEDFRLLKLPNGEVRRKLAGDLRQYYISLQGLNGMHLNSCTASLLESIRAYADESMVQKKLSIFKDTLEECCIPIKQSGTVPNHEVFKEFLFHLLFATGYTLQTELPNSDGKKEDFMLYKNGVAVIIELKYETGADEGLKQIFDKKYYQLFFDLTYCGQGVTDYILMGLDFTSAFKPSVCYLRKIDVDRYGVVLTNGQKIPKMKIQKLVKAARTV